MHAHSDYTRKRLATLVPRYKARIYPETRPVEDLSVSAPCGRISPSQARELVYRPAKLGDQFGPLFTTFWFKGNGAVPAAWAGKRVDLLWSSHSEATLWVDDKTRQGLNESPGWSMPGHTEATLLGKAKGGDPVAFMVEMACNRLFGKSSSGFDHVSSHVLDRCDIALFDPEAFELYFDYLVLFELEKEHEKDLDKAWGGLLLAELNRFANVADPDDPATWAEGKKILKALYEKKNASHVHEVSAIGHAHIDTAWLWPLAETERKCERTFSTQLAYMDEVPGYKFGCSQAAQYAFIKAKNPELYQRIKKKVAEGQFIPVGGSWVEPDCNIPSGESLIRQFVLGQQFFRDEFGITCREFWQPDVFGYNGQLPQIMRQVGIARFVTQKLSWNAFNKPLHHTFLWEGIDGSQVLAHFPPNDNYNSRATVGELCESQRKYKDSDRSKDSLFLFGCGDGGGGPTRDMLARLVRVGDLQGVPRTAMRSPSEFFDRLEADYEDRVRIVGELYFELHRGTYTTQAKTKLGNRKSEVMLHDLEFLTSVASRLGTLTYPSADLTALWQKVLTNQFHDVLPGSSIALVYEDAARDYAEIADRAKKLTAEAVDALSKGLSGGQEKATPINTIGFARREVALHPDLGLVEVVLPPYGPGRIEATGDEVTITRPSADRIVLENAHLRAELSSDGSLTSLVEKAKGREALGDPGNVLEIYDDHPHNFDAWDVDPFHLETGKACPPAKSVAMVEQSPLRASVQFERDIGKKSSAKQTVRLSAGSRRLEFHTEVDWNDRHKLLKAAFPVNVRAMNATYEMQFGHVERPTHFNTPYDLARYEVPGHRWADLSEHGFGVALLSESKYGWSTLGSTMRMTLLRAPGEPDPDADRGHHVFSYAVFPHAGGLAEGGVVAEGYGFNHPVLWAKGSLKSGSLFSVSDPNLVLDTVKRAEKDDALVLRLYEAHGARGTAEIKVGLPFSHAELANALEEGQGSVESADGVVRVPYRPFQIITLKLR
jgi:alpha-mannosidase